MTGGVAVDLVVEVGGPGTLNESLHAVRYGGSREMFEEMNRAIAC
ncbi:MULTISPECIES: hypothetical protein [Fischerella]|nr:MULTISPECIES: hypothetical protein [Fischerella]BAU07762.1 hypothetical protein FIS3754_36970 [Fischerella sp. NIES-3754]